MTHVPTSRITEIHAGNCVAFVGAGFSATVIPPWGKLLSELARSSTTDIQNHVTSQVRKGSAHALDEAAQVLQDHLGEDAFLDMLASLLNQHDERPMSQRRAWLLGVLVPRMIRSAFPRSGDEDQAGDDSNRTSSPTI